MRRFAIAFIALLFAAPLHAQAQSNAAAIQEACMREVRAELKAGQKLTDQQRRVAEEQCRARAEAAAQSKK